MGTETDEFLAEMLPKHHAAELSFRNGDAGPRLALWSRVEPVSWLGQYGGCVTGAAEVTEHFRRVASRFTDVREFRFELIAADVTAMRRTAWVSSTSSAASTGGRRTA